MLINPIEVGGEVYPIGSIVETYAPPSDNWMLCNGDVLAQADYSTLFSLMKNPHPKRFSEWELVQDIYGYGTYGYGPAGNAGIAYNGTIWCWLGQSDNYTYTSDGETYYNGAIGVSGTFYKTMWNGSVFCSLDYGSAVGITSPDGSTWTSRTLSASGAWGACHCWDGTYFVAIPYSQTQVIRSTDGINWSNVTTVKDMQYSAMASNGSRIVATTYGGQFAYSDDHGSTWDYGNIGYLVGYGVSYENSLFIATSSNYGDKMAISTDGVDWEIFSHDIRRKGQLGSNFVNYAAYSYIVRYIDDVYIMPNTYSDYFGISDDGRIWEPVSVPYNQEWCDCFFVSSSDYLYVIGYSPPALKAKNLPTSYNTGTHFQLPDSNLEVDITMNHKRKYIRVE